jgi:hypothetical protein
VDLFLRDFADLRLPKVVFAHKNAAGMAISPITDPPRLDFLLLLRFEDRRRPPVWQVLQLPAGAKASSLPRPPAAT